MSVVVVGLNHRTVPLHVLERMTVSSARLPKALHDLCTRPHLSEAVVLSTCNRTEIYAVAERYHGALDDVRRFLTELSDLGVEDFSDHLYAYHDESAVAHLLKVSSGLDSAVLGEGEILGQVRQGWERARSEGAAGPELGRLFRHAVEAGKRVRSETGIARGTTSVPQAAVAMAGDRLGGLGGRSILILGAGDMGEGMAVALAASSGAGSGGGGRVLVANRTWAKATALAARVGGEAVELGALGTAIEQADVVLTSTGSSGLILEAVEMAAVMAARRDRPLLIVDVAVPRDVEAAVGEIPSVTLLDMDDLRAFAEAGIAGRRREIAIAQRIVDDEVDRYLCRATAREVTPLVVALRSRGEEVRLAELARYRARLAGLDPRQQEAVEALTRGILSKLFHEPTVRLKDSAGTARADRLADAVRTLFDL